MWGFYYYYYYFLINHSKFGGWMRLKLVKI